MGAEYMGQIKSIKLHIVTDIKNQVRRLVTSLNNIKMTNTIEKPIAEPVEEKKVEKEPVPEPESTTEDKPAEPEVNGNGKAEEENGNGHTEEPEEEEGNGDVKETEEEETTLKRKDAPTEVEEDSPKKKKLIDADEKEAEVVEA